MAMVSCTHSTPGATSTASSAGGNFSWNTGVDYRRQLAASGNAQQVRALYRAAGLDLDADLGRLEAAPRIAADPDVTLARWRTLKGAASQAIVAAGKHCGDLVHPLPFAPEFYKQEFESNLADMVNSVKNRMNAQSACAAQFVYWHMDDTTTRLDSTSSRPPPANPVVGST